MKIMIIDGLNLYFRAFLMDESLSPNGQPIGGIKGSLKILQKLITENTPDKIYFCWDGPKSSIRRRAINSNYKEGRKPIKLREGLTDLTEEEQKVNKYWQQARFVEYMNYMPISQLYFEYLEADDIIAILCRDLKDDKKIIVSNDKDYLQLLDENTVVYRSCMKKIYNLEMTLEEYNIHPQNFALARAIVGDSSDNLPGAKGVGMKTVATKFPQMKEEKTIYLKDIIEQCKNELKPLKIHQSIIDSEKLIAENYDLMQLYAPSISIDSRNKIRESAETYPASFNKTEIKKMMTLDGVGNYSWDMLFANLNKISLTNK